MIKKQSLNDRSGLKNDFRTDRHQTGQVHSLFVVHTDAAAGDAFADFAFIVVAMDAVETTPRRAVGEMNFERTHEIQGMFRRNNGRQVDAFFLECRSGNRRRIPGRVELDFRNPPCSHRLGVESLEGRRDIIFLEQFYCIFTVLLVKMQFSVATRITI